MPARPDPAKKARARAVVRLLAKANPDWGPTLRFSNPLELLVATILAAQAQDERVNEVTIPLFAKYRTPRDYVRAPRAALEKAVKATGFYRQKTKAIQAASQGLLDEFGGEVPGDMESLTRLHGVGRKTASIVLGNAFGVPSIAVDRHVARVAQRLGFTKSGDPERIEEDLRALLPKKDWVKATWSLVLHGRRICRPTPECPRCPVLALCPYPRKTKALPARSAAATSAGQPAGRRRGAHI
ncbi:MAG: endonuclease III [Chloroflexi bacterium]|nr:endonuclease III [Chloroflexota bacterium]